ncbi:hypothetical protein [Lysobacter silvisoli]|uniref:hypothetical protein n=1 Tax=Lysobacter silvisoli TaxID=2293254 RepID=UPI0013147514|nr:hypothetical protein [Lysobacter silvisoli]
MPAALTPLLMAAALALQPPGQFHGDEPVGRDGETWLALRVADGRASLTQTRLRVEAVEDPIGDEPGERTGKRVASALEPDPDAEGAQVVAYLRGGGLGAGPVSAARMLQRGEAGHAPDDRFEFAGAAYRIRSECSPDDDGAFARSCTIRLVAPGTEQVLAHMPGLREQGVLRLGDDASPTLIFAGDLDRDGKLDLIFDLTDHYNVSRPTLLLSSQAREGELLHAVSTYESVGC